MQVLLLISGLFIVGGLMVGVFTLLFDLHERWLGYSIILLFIGVAAGIISNGSIEADREKQFMQSCSADHKDYECEAMWRAGRSKSVPVVVPFILPPLGR